MFSQFGWSASSVSQSSLGQFTGSTGAQILTPRELASGTQAWAKKVHIYFLKYMDSTLLPFILLQ